jgi:hypothetical protein
MDLLHRVGIPSAHAKMTTLLSGPQTAKIANRVTEGLWRLLRFRAFARRVNPLSEALTQFRPVARVSPLPAVTGIQVRHGLVPDAFRFA